MHGVKKASGIINRLVFGRLAKGGGVDNGLAMSLEFALQARLKSIKDAEQVVAGVAGCHGQVHVTGEKAALAPSFIWAMKRWWCCVASGGVGGSGV